MKILVTRIKKGTVKVDKKIKALVNEGAAVFVGIQAKDTESKIPIAVKKIINLRIFGDNSGKMSYSLQEKKGSILCVPNFTLCASTKKGKRPCFKDAMRQDQAEKIFNKLVRLLEAGFENVKPALFGANMDIELILEGPVNIILEI